MPGSTSLHVEIAAILAESGEEWMTTSSIASEVNARGHYEKADGSPVTSYQIHGRTRKYPRLFERDGSRVRLRVASPGGTTGSPSRRFTLQGAPADLVSIAVESLSQFGRQAGDVLAVAPAVPGLYAVTTTAEGRADLGFDGTARFLYVGKAESSLAARDVDQHFATGQTGRSTLRRSLAALLAQKLDLRAVPRNLGSPEHFDRYSLDAPGDQRLTSWMLSHLLLAYWPAPDGVPLRSVEIAVIRRLAPAMNLTDVVTPFTARVKAQRRVLAAQARTWAERQRSATV